MAQELQKLWIETPLIKSNHLSALLGCDAYLKLENLQPSQSFKYRGISLFAQHCKETHGPSVHLIIASGGNAGLAAASAAGALGLRCTVYIPEGVSRRMVDALRKEGAEVIIIGKYYLQALQKAEEAVEADKDSVMVPAYDDPIVWKGHASMIEEISKQLNTKPNAIFCSVGGGGLLGGIITGCKDAGWDDVPVVALETHGSACFYHSISVNQNGWQSDKTLPKGITASIVEQHGITLAHVSDITSRASSLGATSPAAGVVRQALDRTGGIICITVPDEMSMDASILFAEDHKFLVELACATTLVPAYKPSLFSSVMSLRGSGNSEARERNSVVFIVCGGTKISLEEVEEYRTEVEAMFQSKEEMWEVRCNGERWSIPK